MGSPASPRAQIGDLVGPATGELTTVSTVDPIKAYYNVTEQAYINFTKRFSDEVDRYERLKQLEINLILADGSRLSTCQARFMRRTGKSARLPGRSGLEVALSESEQLPSSRPICARADKIRYET